MEPIENLFSMIIQEMNRVYGKSTTETGQEFNGKLYEHFLIHMSEYTVQIADWRIYTYKGDKKQNFSLSQVSTCLSLTIHIQQHYQVTKLAEL